MQRVAVAAFGCQTFIAYGVLGKGGNQLSSFIFFYSLLLLARFAVKSGGREGTDFPRALWIVLLFMPVHSGHQVRGLVLADKVFLAGPELVSAVSKVLAPHPVTKVQCI